jgi:hypothetical protein
MRVAAGNIGFALSYWLFADSYRFYRIQKRLFNAVFGCKTPIMEAPKHQSDAVVIQGFRHSGNSFVISNIVEADRGRLPMAWHRVWIMKVAIKKSLPIIVLIRQPRDVVASTVYRTSTRKDDPYAPFLIFPWAALLAWIGYYSWIKRFRHSVVIVPLDLVERDYQYCRQVVAERSGLRMNDSPSWKHRNQYGGDRWDLQLSPLSRMLLRKAETIYYLLLDMPSDARTDACTL